MNKKRLIALTMIGTLVLAGCETAGPDTTTGAVAGGLLGATAGGIIGNQSGEGLEGAAIGAGIGAVSGALIGNSMDRSRAPVRERVVTHEYRTVTVRDVVEMTADGMPDTAIIDEIQASGSTYHLDSATIAYLKSHNVSDRVIDYMLETSY